MSEMENTQPEKTKAELFAENPDRFEDLEKVLVMVKRHPETGQLGIIINPSAGREMSFSEAYEECLKLKSYVEHKLGKYLDGVELKAAQRAKMTEIQKPNGSNFMNGIRSLGRKR